MTNAQTQRLLSLLHEAELDATVDVYGELHYRFACFQVRISPRPIYCDRGRWLLHAESTDCREATLDWADGFPRYYFNDHALVAELVSWRKARLRAR